MATYKVLQDIEAEDKFLGPLTLRQFIYGAIAAVCGYISFFALSRGVWIVLVFFLPFILISGFLAWPWSKDQPTEVWLLAKLRFMVKPRKRVWDQSGLKQLVTITAPKKLEQIYTNGLSQNEVRSRLRALADTIDSRGWAVKNVNVNLNVQPSLITNGQTDRLLDPSSIPQAVPTIDVLASEDIMDDTSTVSQHLSQMIQASSKSRRQQLMDKVRHAAQKPQEADQPNDYWFMNQNQQTKLDPGYATFGTQVVAPGTPQEPVVSRAPSATDQAILEELHHQKPAANLAYEHLRTIKPLSQQAPAPTKTSPTPTDPVILELAKNDDLNVATIARQANRTNEHGSSDGEVVVSLH